MAHIETEIEKARQHKQYYEKKKKDHDKVVTQLTDAVNKVKKEIEVSSKLNKKVIHKRLCN